jgi:DNA-binding FrmR family transcriptional regulator
MSINRTTPPPFRLIKEIRIKEVRFREVPCGRPGSPHKGEGTIWGAALNGGNSFLTNGEGWIKLCTIGGYSMETERQKKDVLQRLRRIEGQVRGIQKMVEGGVPCQDILTQVAAATAAIKKVGVVVVQTYMNECLHKTQKGPNAQKEETLKDLQRAISRYIDWA